MVNNKKTKREKDIKSKLLAAVAMLLVSSIMMVSTTYAWFTLSTAPEVTGITTTIGANGNLEIALSPKSGVGSDVGDADLTTGDSWLVKNLTWGNLVDMKDPSYGLAELTLAPAQLALSGTAGSFALGTNVLGTPSYGSDGRIAALEADAYIAGKAEGTTGYATVDADYGVRAVGTASGMSPQESKFKTSVNAIGNYANAAISAAANSLSANGDALAAMLVMHAEAGSGTDTTNNYAEFAPNLLTLTKDLQAALVNIDEALRASLAAAASTISDETKFNTAISAIEGKGEDGAYTNSLETLVQNAGTYGFTVPSEFANITAKRNALATRINAAVTAAEALMAAVDTDNNGEVDEGADKKWADVSPVLTDLMNTSGTIKVSGHSIDEIKSKMDEMDFLLGLATNCQIELGEGSGVYYDLAQITGNIAAKVPKVPITARGISVTLENVIIKTTVPANTSYLPLMKTAMAATPPVIEGSTTVLDAYYGYVIDLMVRTNAADSYLKLQTTPAQRVYSDSANADTLGAGTTIVFKTTEQTNVATLDNLIRSIRVVFFDPSHEDAVFGLAKVTSVVITEKETGETKEIKDAEGNVTGTEAVIEYTITGSLELCAIENGAATGMYVAGEKLTGDTAAYLCALSQNIPQAISALVYLDGQDVTSADVLADKDVEGALNLQFASSATLVPMENSDLRNGTGANAPANP